MRHLRYIFASLLVAAPFMVWHRGYPVAAIACALLVLMPYIKVNKLDAQVSTLPASLDEASADSQRFLARERRSFARARSFWILFTYPLTARFK